MTVGAKMVVNVAFFCFYLLIVVVLGFFLWQTLFASEKYRGTPNAEATHSEQKNKNENALGIGAPPEGRNPAEQTIADYTRWLAFFTAALVLATIALFISGERNVDVARRSAFAAEQSAEVAKTALISTQRAFLFIATFETHVINNEFRILPQWKNSGTTPANPVTNYANWKTFTATPPTDYTYPDIAADGTELTSKGDGPSFYVGPQDAVYAESLKIPIPWMEKVRAGEQRLFIWGWAEYRDAFEGTPIHRSEFCNEVIVTNMGRDGEKVTIAVQFAKYGPYNKAN
jgi:hypothetical protein